MKMFPLMIDSVGKEMAELREACSVSMVICLPWQMLEAHADQAQKNHSQSLETLASRGGLAPCEALAVLEDRAWRAIPVPRAHAMLKEKFMIWQKWQARSPIGVS